jgi:hypothetical protein
MNQNEGFCTEYAPVISIHRTMLPASSPGKHTNTVGWTHPEVRGVCSTFDKLSRVVVLTFGCGSDMRDILGGGVQIYKTTYCYNELSQSGVARIILTKPLLYSLLLILLIR